MLDRDIPVSFSHFHHATTCRMPRLASPKSCLTCRRRKVKCDEATPICNRCLKAGYECDRSSNLIFKQATTSERIIEEDKPSVHLQKPHIANLFHTYLKDLAPWYDLNDPACAFAKEAPSRALKGNNMLLFSAIVALAACYSARKFSSSLALAESYHERCLKLLIDLSPTDEAVQNGIALATTCLLRSYEIMSEDTDPNRHLFGASTLLPAEALALQGKSLLASGFWNYLREDITYSLIHRCPLKIKTKQPSRDMINTGNVANAMTLFLAHAINLLFNEQESAQRFQLLEQEMGAYWRTWEPKPFACHDRDSDVFPVIRMVSDTDVAACHYFKVASSIVSKLNRPRLAAEICGLAISSLSDAVIVNAYGPICFVGRWLEIISQRNMLIKWLNDSQRGTAWNVKFIVEDLRKAWALENSGEQ